MKELTTGKDSPYERQEVDVKGCDKKLCEKVG